LLSIDLNKYQKQYGEVFSGTETNDTSIETMLKWLYIGWAGTDMAVLHPVGY
jgi:hypothetical protein